MRTWEPALTFSWMSRYHFYIIMEFSWHFPTSWVFGSEREWGGMSGQRVIFFFFSETICPYQSSEKGVKFSAVGRLEVQRFKDHKMLTESHCQLFPLSVRWVTDTCNFFLSLKRIRGPRAETVSLRPTLLPGLHAAKSTASICLPVHVWCAVSKEASQVLGLYFCGLQLWG